MPIGGGKMKVKKIYVGGFLSNTYIIYDDEGCHCVIADPSFPLPEFEKRSGMKRPDTVILTHGHFDHISALQSYIDGGVPFIIHPEDEPMLTDGMKNASVPLLGYALTVSGVPVPFTDVVSVGNETLKIMHTPGHSNGSVSYVGDNFIITGDTLFAHGDFGRTDLWGGNIEKLRNSYLAVLNRDADMKLYPGHGADTSVFYERELSVFN